ncbi:DUF3348 domain-containing protein [Dyella choica]|uniref:DUF3348 domain-containing protein n=1 Tax=Dyella choica TaxID=1927959 RepID=A0A432M9R5_9GAMM|nr:DUF3348 domain-containing protein [Dyella choica]RUL78943.1 DUF3348 domain-containing protein [Dyella choica]
MTQTTRRTMVRGPTFIRLLARLTEVADVPAPSQSLSCRLSDWLDWSQAVALSTALDGKPSLEDSGAPLPGGTEEDACARVRMALTQTIVGDQALTVLKTRGHGKTIAEERQLNPSLDYTVFRQHYLTMQRRMQTAVGNLRSQLRGVLAQKSADMAHLAQVDAAMEVALSPREQKLMASVPALLGKHFERLRQHRQDSRTAPDAWLNLFRKDMQSLLLAELDVRFQPVDGLLAALRAR